MKYSDEAVDAFCHQEKCITFFRVTKEGTKYFQDENMVRAEHALHGEKIGFLVRNGENLYCGWMEDEWKEDSPLTFEEELFYRSGATTLDAVGDGAKTESTPVNERVSRVFAMSVVQGLIDQKQILDFPEPVNILKPSKYIVYNFADKWIDDNRYGDFATLVSNLHHYNKEGDKILLVKHLSDRTRNGDRGIGYANRTHDCFIQSGLNKINKIEDGDFYVAAHKSWSDSGATANFRVDEGEFLNLTYFNSLWMEYYIMTKKVGAFGTVLEGSGFFKSSKPMPYSYLIPFFREALFFLRGREKEEAQKICAYYPQLGDMPEWQVKLSNWKILNKVRIITDYQAKRFAAYLGKGKFQCAANLFEKWAPERAENLGYKYNTTELSLPSQGRGMFRHNAPNYASHEGEHALYGWANRMSFAYKTKEELEGDPCFAQALENDYRKVLCIQDELLEMVRKHDVTDADIRKMYPEPSVTDEDCAMKAMVREFCLGFDIKQEIPSYDMMMADSQKSAAFSRVMGKAGKLEGVLFPLYYYRILQDNLLYRVNSGINRLLEERYKVEATD